MKKNLLLFLTWLVSLLSWGQTYTVSVSINLAGGGFATISDEGYIYYNEAPTRRNAPTDVDIADEYSNGSLEVE